MSTLATAYPPPNSAVLVLRWAGTYLPNPTANPCILAVPSTCHAIHCHMLAMAVPRQHSALDFVVWCNGLTGASIRQPHRYIMVDLKFKYPMAVSLMGMAMSGILAFVCCRVLKVVEMNAVVRFRFWATKILPIGWVPYTDAPAVVSTLTLRTHCGGS